MKTSVGVKHQLDINDNPLKNIEMRLKTPPRILSGEMQRSSSPTYDFRP